MYTIVFQNDTFFKHLGMYYNDKETLIKVVSMTSDAELIIKVYANAILPLIRKKDPEFDPIIVNKSLKIIKTLDDEIINFSDDERETFYEEVDQAKLEVKSDSYYDISEEDDVPFPSLQYSRQLSLRNYYNEVKTILTKPYEKLMLKVASAVGLLTIDIDKLKKLMLANFEVAYANIRQHLVLKTIHVRSVKFSFRVY